MVRQGLDVDHTTGAVTGRPSARVGLVLVGLAGAGALLQSVLSAQAPPSDLTTAGLATAAALLVAFAVTEVAVVHVPAGRNTYTLTFSEIPLVAGLFLLDPLTLVVVRLLGALPTLAARTRRSPRKLVFNCLWYWVEVALAVVIWTALGGTVADPTPATWLAAAVVAVTVDAAGTLVIAVVVAVDSRTRPPLGGLLSEANPLIALINASAALVVVYVVTVDWRALWTLGVVVGVLVFAQRSHNRLRRRTETLEELSRFTGQVGGQLDVDSAARAALGWMADTLEVEVVELSLDEEFLGRRCRWQVRHGGPVEVLEGPGAGAVLGPWVAAGPLRVPRGTRDESRLTMVRTLGLRDVMAMALTDDGRRIGTLVVGGRLGDVKTFESSDLQGLVALGNHLAVTLRSARRADQLREHAADRLRRSLHDELTGLPNRRSLEELLSAHLATGGGASAVMLDLDRFKDINDTLGHHTGDVLLRQVAQRLQEVVPDDGVVARLGGDDFAVLLRTDLARDVDAVVATICAAFTVPFDLDDLQVTVEASIGVAVSTDSTVAEDLLRRGDIAMFEAKTRRTGVEVYRDALEVGSLERLTLLTELRAAITSGELIVHYQPQVRLRDGQVTGVEALVRWQHPRRGVVPPDEFIPVAEHSGLITPLTFAVLRQALADCSAWRAAGHPLGLAVNVSPRSLLEPSFVDDVAHILAAVEVPSSALTLEITESSLMADPDRAVAALDRLRGLGVHLSIDDLGTGYSSLSYLQRLPADEVKIDRSFLSPGEGADDRLAIVGAIIDLGHRLGRHVVAEGVEDEQTWRLLQSLGCDTAQGYWMSRPQPTAALTEWLAAWRPTQVAALRAIS